MGPNSHGRLYAFLYARWWLTFVLLGISFVLFGFVTLNLLHTLMANFEFLSMYGVEAVRDGGLQQLLEIVGSGYFAAASYVVFKVCERVLVERLVSAKGVDA